MTPKLHRLLAIQGELLDQHLSQNLEQRYAYLILVAPEHGPFHVGAISNVANRALIEPLATAFAKRLTCALPAEVVEIGPAQTMEAGHA